MPPKRKRQQIEIADDSNDEDFIITGASIRKVDLSLDSDDDDDLIITSSKVHDDPVVAMPSIDFKIESCFSIENEDLLQRIQETIRNHYLKCKSCHVPILDWTEDQLTVCISCKQKICNGCGRLTSSPCFCYSGRAFGILSILLELEVLWTKYHSDLDNAAPVQVSVQSSNPAVPVASPSNNNNNNNNGGKKKKKGKKSYYVPPAPAVNYPKGIGYGTSTQIYGQPAAKSSQQQNQFLLKREQITSSSDFIISQLLRSLIQLLPKPFNNSPFDNDPPMFVQDVFRMSCLLNSTRPMLTELLRNDCFQDIAKRWSLYECLFQLIVALSNHPMLSPLLDISELLFANVKHPLNDICNHKINGDNLRKESVVSIRDMVVNIHRQAQIFIQAVSMQDQEDVTDDELDASTIAIQLVSSIDHFVSNNSKAVSSSNAPTNNNSLADDSYVDACRKLSFDYYEGLSGQLHVPKQYPHHHNILMNQQQVNAKSNTLKIAQEIASLSTNLPVSEATSVFLRVDEEQLDKMQAIIVGPEGTPYENGLFLFDIVLPPQYPQVSPKVQLRTTGKGMVRFNPNLYNCGKVCLSLLGTWQGAPEEQWQPGKSTLLQVLLSIQSMILIDLPYFNEPGFGAPNANNPQSKMYNEHIRKDTLTWAMIDMIKNPPEPFKQVVETHFRMKRDYILQTQMPNWKSLNTITPQYAIDQNLISQLETAIRNL